MKKNLYGDFCIEYFQYKLIYKLEESLSGSLARKTDFFTIMKTQNNPPPKKDLPDGKTFFSVSVNPFQA